jgi:hypothetical protein
MMIVPKPIPMVMALYTPPEGYVINHDPNAGNPVQISSPSGAFFNIAIIPKIKSTPASHVRARKVLYAAEVMYNVANVKAVPSAGAYM